MLCSNCFSDFGLIETAKRIGRKSKHPCKNCGSFFGAKLNFNALHKLAFEFFVNGSFMRTYYGGFNRIEYNEYHRPFSRKFDGCLNKDARLISRKLGIGFFDYAPKMWRLGFITQLENLEKPKKRNIVIKEILENYPIRYLTRKDHFFRLRKDITSYSSEDFDSAPRGKSKARFNLDGYPTLYGSDNLEICIHECRAAISDEIFVAKIRPKRKLKCLDLSAEGPELIDAFESLSIAMFFLFNAEEHSYVHLTRVARALRAKRFDGIIFPSYFNQLKSNRGIQNIALFGRPIRDGRVKVECINKLLLRQADYQFDFGPMY